MILEELTELRRFDQGLHLSHCCAEASTEPTLQGDNLHHGCTTICRLCLRCVWDSIERLLADEREKVRQKCIETLERREPSSHAWFEAKRLIRQLDLTKPESDLVLSNRKEKG